MNTRRKVSCEGMPFSRARKVSSQAPPQVDGALDGKSVVIVGLDGAERHWTVAYAVTERTLRVADSCGMRVIARSQCAVGRTSLRYRLRPTEVLVVKREKS
jgi:hypothetical protein